MFSTFALPLSDNHTLSISLGHLSMVETWNSNAMHFPLLNLCAIAFRNTFVRLIINLQEFLFQDRGKPVFFALEHWYPSTQGFSVIVSIPSACELCVTMFEHQAVLSSGSLYLQAAKNLPQESGLAAPYFSSLSGQFIVKTALFIALIYPFPCGCIRISRTPWGGLGSIPPPPHIGSGWWQVIRRPYRLG